MIHADDMAVTAGRDQTDKRRFQLRVGDKVRAHVPLDMIDRNQRLIHRVSQRLCPAHAGQKRAHETRPEGHAHRVNIRKRKSRLLQRAIQKRVERLHVHSGSDLGHHAAVQRVGVHLRRDFSRQHAAAVLHNRNRGFVARRFHRENARVSLFTERFRLTARVFNIAHSSFILLRIDLTASDAAHARTVYKHAAIPVYSAIR